MLADHLPSGDHALTLLAALTLLLTIALLPRTFLFLGRLVSRSPCPLPPSPTKPKSFYGPRSTTAPTPLDLTNTPPSPSPSPETAAPDPWYRDPYISPRVYTATMALRALPAADWLRIDANYAARMAHKRAILAAHGWPRALDCRPEAEPAVRELLAALAAYLPRRFPSVWVAEAEGEGEATRWLRSRVTGERWEVREPWGGLRPLEVVAGVTEEDVAVLVPPPPGDADGEYVLKAVVSAFPAGFDVEEKIDRGLTAIHGPVPTYKEKLQRAMNKFFKSMSADRLVMRVNWGINDREELFFLEGTHLYEGDEGNADDNIDINQVQLRVERQVLRRLPMSGAMCMMTKTYLYRLVDIAEEPGFAERLGGLLHKLPEKFAFYKRKPVWGKVVLAYLDEMAAKHPAIPTEDD